MNDDHEIKCVDTRTWELNQIWGEGGTSLKSNSLKPPDDGWHLEDDWRWWSWRGTEYELLDDSQSWESRDIFTFCSPCTLHSSSSPQCALWTLTASDWSPGPHTGLLLVRTLTGSSALMHSNCCPGCPGPGSQYLGRSLLTHKGFFSHLYLCCSTCHSIDQHNLLLTDNVIVNYILVSQFRFPGIRKLRRKGFLWTSGLDPVLVSCSLYVVAFRPW